MENLPKEKIFAILKDILPQNTPIELAVPDEEAFGHYSTNVALRLAGMEKKKPLELAEALAAEIRKKAPPGFFKKVEAAAPGFINFWASTQAFQAGFASVAKKNDFGKSDAGKKKKVIVEYSAPNIAKTMHVGHFRNTIIGDALANILEHGGYKVVRWNYLGDWGTQFGKIIAAYKRWGNKEEVQKNPIEEMQKLYVRFHAEEKDDQSLAREGQEEFRKLEEGNKENRKLWEWFREESIRELKKIYARFVSADFDVWIGESFFEEEMKPLVAELLKTGVAERSEGAVVIKLDQFNLPPALIEKSDGASLYLTRDIANLKYRLAKYKPEKIFYVIGNEQSLHFEQLFAIAKILKLDTAKLSHIKYGLVLGEGGKKFSTREGRTEPLTHLLDEAILKTKEVLREKRPDLPEARKNEIAEAVGIGALKYNDLKENRMTDIAFDWGSMLDFSGDSGPYLQYTYARLRSILRKAGKSSKGDAALLESEHELALIRKIFEFPDIVAKAGELSSTSTLATYLYKLAARANKFYETTPILAERGAKDDARRDARLMLVATAARTLQSGLALLGIRTLEEI